MADTARSDQFSILMRKIGYSVGLENTFARVRDLAEHYLATGSVSLGDWRALVEDQWGLKSHNIGDFFGALGIIKVSKTQLDVMPGLDILSISRSGLVGEQADRAQAVALLSLLIEHDGEVFLNCLAGGFEADAVTARLTELIHYKRGVLFGLFKSPGVQADIARVVGIDRQVKNTGGGAPAKSLSDQRRREPLTNRQGALSRPTIPDVVISEDYLRKVPPRRRDWAVSLGLWEADGGLTLQGVRLFAELERLGLVLKGGAVVVWPFEHEMSRLRLNPKDFEGKLLGYSDLLTLAVIGGGGECEREARPGDVDALRSLLLTQLEQYRTLNRPKAMLRREYPLTIACPAAAAHLVAVGTPVPPVLDLIGPTGPMAETFQFRSSRNSLGGLMSR